MKIIEVRKNINRLFLFFGMFWLVQALYGLYTDKAIVITMPHFHVYEVDIVPLFKDSKTYWSYIKFQFICGLPFIFISFVKFPFLDPFFLKIQAEQSSGTRPFAWVITWFKENKTALLISRSFGLIAWLMVISGIIFLIIKFTR